MKTNGKIKKFKKTEWNTEDSGERLEIKLTIPSLLYQACFYTDDIQHICDPC